MKKLKDYLVFIPSVVVVAAVVVALFSYDDGEASSALAKIDSVKKSMDVAPVSTSASDVSGESQKSDESGSEKKSIKIGKRKNKEKTSQIAQLTSINHVTAKIKSQNIYKDGTYTGTGSGFNGGNTTARVTVKDGKIISVTFTNQDTAQFFSKAVSVLKPAILSNGKQSVDTVSGATYSSNGIIESVNNALSKAGDTRAHITKKKKSSVRPEKSKTPAKAKAIRELIPGTYSASAICGPDPKMPLWDAYTIEFDVKVAKNGSVTMTTPKGTKGYYDEDDGIYLEKAYRGMILSLTSQEFFDTNLSLITGKSSDVSTGSSVSSEKIDLNNIKVDTVSGATYSSKAIKEAFVKALEKAVSHE